MSGRTPDADTSLPSTPALTPDDAAWFAAHPHRGFRCRRLTADERAVDTGPYADLDRPELTRVRYVRRTDGASVNAWTPQPDFCIAEEDEGRHRWACQSLPGAEPPDEPSVHIDLDALAAPARASVRVLEPLPHR